jgi:hypothetical protein
MSDEQIATLKQAALAVSPQDLDTAQYVNRYEDGSHIDCPTCGGEGYAEIQADFCNYDGHALGVQFYGIGNHHGEAEAYFRAASPAVILELIDRLELAESRVAELEPELRKMKSDAAHWKARAKDAEEYIDGEGK